MIEIDGAQHSGSGATIDRHASDQVIPFASLVIVPASNMIVMTGDPLACPRIQIGAGP